MSLFRRKYRDPKTREIKTSKAWSYEFEWRGARVRETTKSTNREVAGRIERERRRDLELGIAGLRRIGGPLTVTQLRPSSKSVSPTGARRRSSSIKRVGSI